MTDRPRYNNRHVSEDDLTVDWYFGSGHLARKIWQSILIIIGWFFAILPIVITLSAVFMQDSESGGWWRYSEGIDMWNLEISIIFLMTVVFVIAFGYLYVTSSIKRRREINQITYDEERLRRRLMLSAEQYDDRFGPTDARWGKSRVLVPPEANIGTFELRERFAEEGVGL